MRAGVAVSVVDALPGAGLLRRAEELCRAGRLDEARRLTRVVIDENLGDVTAHRLLAHIEHTRGDRAGESLALEALLSFEPDNARIWTRLGALAVEFGQSDKACHAYRRATRLAAGEYANWHGLALAALAANRLPMAQQAGKELLQRFIDRAGSHLIAGHLAKAVGDEIAAVAAYQRALEIDPTSSEAAFSLVEQRVPLLTEPLAVHVGQLAGRVELTDIDAANLGFACARIQEAAGDYEGAFHHYSHANAAAARAMQRRGIVYEPGAVEHWVDGTIRSYPATTFRTPPETLATGIRLIFIVGMPRSGTTLVEQILTSHPRVTSGGSCLSRSTVSDSSAGAGTNSATAARSISRSPASAHLSQTCASYTLTDSSSAISTENSSPKSCRAISHASASSACCFRTP